MKTRVVRINEWINPPKESEAAQALLNGGADVLFQNTDSSAVLQTADKAGKLAFGWDSDMTPYGPQAHLRPRSSTGPLATEGDARRARRHVEDGQGVAGRVGRRDRHRLDLRQGAGTDQGEGRGDEIGLKDGSFSIWKGPIVDNAGNEVLPKDKVADDEWLGGIKFYVRGVEGKVPGGK